MSNYRVRQVMKLRRPQRQKDFLVGLATFMTDDGRTCRAGLDAVMEAAGQSRNTARAARRELEEAGDLASRPTGTGRGHVTEWDVPCLPEASPEIAKGVSASDPLPGGKGVSAFNPVSYADPLPDERGSNGSGKGGQGQGADQQEPNTLNSRLVERSSLRPAAPGLRAALAAVVPDVTERETEAVIGILKGRGAQSAGAVLRAEIRDGTAPDLVAEVRARAGMPASSADRRPASVPYGALCARCGQPHGNAGSCAARVPEPPAAGEPPKLSAVPSSAGKRCGYAACPGRPGDIDRDGYHVEVCAYLALVKAPRDHSEAS